MLPRTLLACALVAAGCSVGAIDHDPSPADDAGPADDLPPTPPPLPAVAIYRRGSLAPLLFETSPHDPLVFGGVATALVVIALAASWIPALRASRVDPSTALRAD